MRVGVYIDGYNLYYGGKYLCDDGDSWKWLSPRDLVSAALASQQKFAVDKGYFTLSSAWAGANVTRVVYCTARVSGTRNPSSAIDQDAYLKAIVEAKAVDHIEFGNYVSRVKVAPLAVKTSAGPELFTSRWPIMLQDSSSKKVEDAVFLASYLHNEEKGSDVNVASHLLVDVLGGVVDAAVVVSNDSDLGYPVEVARSKVPVGVINPRGGQTAGSLRPPGAIGSTHHWARKLRKLDFLGAQMPENVGTFTRPAGW